MSRAYPARLGQFDVYRSAPGRSYPGVIKKQAQGLLLEKCFVVISLRKEVIRMGKNQHVVPLNGNWAVKRTQCKSN